MKTLAWKSIAGGLGAIVLAGAAAEVFDISLRPWVNAAELREVSAEVGNVSNSLRTVAQSSYSQDMLYISALLSQARTELRLCLAVKDNCTSQHQQVAVYEEELARLANERAKFGG